MHDDAQPDAAVDSSPGALTRARGFKAGATTAGIKESHLPDMGLLASETVAAAAAVFTSNALWAAPLIVDAEHVADGRIQTVLVNSGNANAATGERGLTDARRMAEIAAARAGCGADEAFVLSTGVIGQYLPMDLIEAGANAITPTAGGGAAFARAIMTTDTFPKEASQRFEAHGRSYTIGGCAKGAGMIHPNMATMLAFLTTDAPVEAPILRAQLREACDRTFNMISVDGDTSTNDTVLLLANGAGGGPPIADAAAVNPFAMALEAVCRKLAIDIARDGEGATKLIVMEVGSAASVGEAQAVARSVVRSPLLKAALSKGDPNWGRVLMAAGNAGVRIDPSRCRLAIGERTLFARGEPTGVPEAQAAEAVTGTVVRIRLELGRGEAAATAWGCDLTEEYVRFNADYVT
ncbi:MAG: bifunctional glutamate N-acetyltransferase/amino-acid acetyltransferase ArgJ [Chloroflexi bacterium]|nr:bifunctional glutamate N-acetyltransferase/amino-acid acetyltransferase ArgJ [Chloroflexota bacterium]